LYRDEFEQRITCIAHGKEENDLEITEEFLKYQFQSFQGPIEEYLDEDESFDDIDDEYDEIKEVYEPVQDDLLLKTAEQYRLKTHDFLKDTFLESRNIGFELADDFEAIAWYHTLLSIKLYRALCGLNEPESPDEFGLYDAVAQLAICKKAIDESIKALRKIKQIYLDYRNLITELLALLNNISSRIIHIEESV